MSKGLLASIAVLLAIAGTAPGQTLGLPDGAIVPPSASTSASAAASISAAAAAPTVAATPAASLTTTPAEPVAVPAPGPGYQLSPADCAPPCDDGMHVWLRSEYLLWWTKGSPNSSPLLTTVPAGTSGATPPIPGAIGNVDTRVLMGGSDIELGARSGARFTIGSWLDHDHAFALEGDYMFLGSVTENQFASSTGGIGAQTLYVPFFDPTGNLTGGTPGHSALPTVLGTTFNVLGGFAGPYISRDVLTLKSQTQGAELHGVFNLYRQGRMRVDGLAGFRYLNLYEQLTFSTNSQSVPSAQTAVTYDTLDSFETTNNFYGGQFGLRLELNPDDGRGGVWGGFDLRADAKLALGETVEGVNINGGTVTNLGNPMLGSPGTFVGGIFTQPTNIGRYSHDQFSFVPEANLSVGYSVSPNVRLFLGYDFLYLSDVARPGAQIDPQVNIYRSGLLTASGIAPPATNPVRPAFNLTETSFWAQGVDFGVEVRF